ncbi:MAG TPA: hypothetical protein PJ990_19060 [Saprospiraceae bacterium]|nr:hypothetical protein [Saprospiraceae bacterium]
MTSNIDLKNVLYDLIGFVIPGAFFIASVILRVSISNPAIIEKINNFKIESFVVIFLFYIVSYVIGFIISIFGQVIFNLYKKFKFLFLKQNIKPNKNPNLTNSEKYSILRKSNDSSYFYIEKWNIMKDFSSSLSISIIFICILFWDKLEWEGILFFFLITIILIETAYTFYRWKVIDLDNSVKNQ